ncbi:HNH endonuclease [Bradyrhizobium sp. DASA03007]|uniref:HNH endonuclease n=1 Tax=unclassified Bradyrhizobium TaxID=2631580 RepID=UPI003F70667A
MLTVERLKQVLRYDAETGEFTWVSPPEAVAWMAGKRAGCLWDHGYRVIVIDGVRHYEHNLAWLYMKGEQAPEGLTVDHEDRNRGNNRWRNLRLATRAQQNANQGAKSTSKTGVRGVHSDGKGKFRARIKINGKSVSLGTYRTVAEGAAAYEAKAKELYGDFACPGACVNANLRSAK